MSVIQVDITNSLPYLEEGALAGMVDPVSEQFGKLLAGTGKGNDFLGWLRLPAETSEPLIRRIQEEAMRLRERSKYVVVIGIGGSYLGARAVIEALSHPFHMIQPHSKGPVILYAGENLGEDYHAGLLDLLDDADYSLIVISKSGTTTEPAVAFRILKQHLERKYGKEVARRRVVAITDKSRGALKSIADQEQYPTFVIPDDVGGRFSVLTPVGLLPIAVAGIDIRQLLGGGAAMQSLCFRMADIATNPATRYAAVRNLLYRSGKATEIMVTYQPGLTYISEWWKQLYGESEGKDGKGIFPASVSFTTDLHSLGQYIQDGPRHMFETVLSVTQPERQLIIPADPGNVDGLNYLAGKRISEVNAKAEEGTLLAHLDGGVPNIRIELPCISAETIGQLLYFYEFACAISGYLLDVNPFDQPGVEAYKKNMFRLLGKK